MEDNIVRLKLVSIENETVKRNFDQHSVNDIDVHALKFQYKINTIIKMSENIVVAIPSIRYTYNDTIIFETSAEFVYSVLTLSDAITVDKEKKKINVKSDIFHSIIGSSYSTLRGMAFIRIKNTPVAKFPAPLIGINTLLQRNGITVID